jgi:ABC-2 type transport system ATP-binding protein
MESLLVRARSLTKVFGTFTAVADVTLQVEAGRILVLLGPNGAGKTTTIRMLASLLRPTRGSATVAGFDVVDQALQVRSSVGLLTEHHGLYTRMRSAEYLEFYGRAYGLEPLEARQRVADLLQRFGLGDALGLRLGEYSKGMRQKLALIRCLLHFPRVLLLDEPTSAMDPQSARYVRETILELRSEDRAVIVCTHNLAEAEMLADEIAVIGRGRILALDSPARLKQRFLGDAVMEIRLGLPSELALGVLPTDAKVVGHGADRVRFTTPSPATTNPRVLQSLAEARLPVVTLAEINHSLEEVYLKVVGQAETLAEEPK